MIAFDLFQGLFRSVVYLGVVLRHHWGRKVTPERWTEQMAAAEAIHAPLALPAPAPAESESSLAAPELSAPQHLVPVPDADYLVSQVLVRYGEGFNVVCHFYRRDSRVVRALWLDYKSLQRKHGAYVVRRLRTRAGQQVARARGSARAQGVTPRRWGRIALPDEFLEFESLQDLRVIRLMEKTLVDAGALIEEEIPENLLNKRPWRLLPPCAAPEHELTDLQKRRKTIERSMEEIRAEDAARKVPLASQDKLYPNMIKPPVVSSHSGVLRKTGYVERTDPSGRKYRTFFAEVEDEVRTIRHIGVDLQRALLREQINIGDRVEVFNIGLVPVGSGKYKKKIWSARKLPA